MNADELTDSLPSASICISMAGDFLTVESLEREWPFPRFLGDNGFQLCPINKPVPSIYLALDYSRKAFRRVKKKVPKERRILVTLEPKAVNPAQYTRRVRDKFGQIIVLSPLQVVDPNDLVHYPGYLSPDRLVQARKLENLNKVQGAVGLVNANKFSFVPSSQYVLRHKAIKKLAHAGVTVNLGGANWSRGAFWQVLAQTKCLIYQLGLFAPLKLANFYMPLARNSSILFHGPVGDHIKFLGCNEFALVIENDPDYLSEKLINAILAGSVPIYCGAPLGLYGIPESVALSVRPSTTEILKVVLSTSAEEKNLILQEGRRWLLDTEVQKYWDHDEGWRRLARTVKEIAMAPSCEGVVEISHANEI